MSVQRILYKREYRRDKVMTVAYWINRLTKLYPYLSGITSHQEHGWIVMLDDTTTLYEIRQQGRTLQTLLDRLSHLTISEFRTHFAGHMPRRACCVMLWVWVTAISSW